MANKSERLTILSDAEQFALYGLPDFDDRQRVTYLALSGPELALASSRRGLDAQIWCALQIGYFKAKHAFSASPGTMHRRTAPSSCSAISKINRSTVRALPNTNTMSSVQ
jgi:hypothetical protein